VMRPWAQVGSEATGTDLEHLSRHQKPKLF
jgi:hypothetical protein